MTALRRALAIPATASLVACLAVCGVWVRSAYVTDERVIEAADATVQLTSGGGALIAYRVEREPGESRWMRPAERWNVLGLAYIEGRLNRRRPWGMLIIPYWIPAAVLAVLPGLWIGLRARDASRQRRDAARGCVRCGAELEDAATACPRCGRATDPGNSPPLAHARATHLT